MSNVKAIPFKIPKQDDEVIRVQIDEGAHFYDKLHYHPELQVSAIIEGQGILYGGNNMVNFQSGDVFLFGANIPHLLKNSSNYYTKDTPGVLSHSLFFDNNSFGSGFFDLKAAWKLSSLLKEAQRGIKVRSMQLVQKISATIEKKDEYLLLGLLDILIEIANGEKEYVNSKFYSLSLDERVGERLNKIIDYTFKNLSERIMIGDIAEIAKLSESQFSRYFKGHTGKTYIQFLNELRIESACTLLKESSLSISEICFKVGFQNVSNFNRKFKTIKDVSPRQYRTQMIKRV